MALQRSKDRKVTNAVTPNGKQASIANTFGLPAGKQYSCPGATSVCEKICYAGKLENVYKNVKNVLVSNYEQLVNASELEQYNLIADMIADFVADCDRRNAPKLFRIHWDGDFFNEQYTRAWAKVIRQFGDVQFWVYTRSAFAVPLLVNIPNLSLYFSTDNDNKGLAIALKDKYGVKLAYLSDTFANGKRDFENIQDKSPVPCPENNRKLKLISPTGSACVTCGQCVFARNDILFSASKT